MIVTTKKATREHTKQHNSRLILKMIYDQGPISRADIARITRLTATTVSSAVSELLDEGLVEEIGSASAARGKPPTLVRVARDGRHLISLDLGRRAFQGAIVNLRGDILHRVSISPNGRTGHEALKLVYHLLDELLLAAGAPLLGIGVGSPGIVNFDQGIICKAVNFDWRNLPLQQMLSCRYELPVYLANDCHVAVLAEYTFGRRKHCPNLVLVRIGHGVGAGVILNGRLYHGHNYGAGEIGHVTIVENGERCSCGNYGCLETIATSRAIVRRAQAVARENRASRLGEFAESVDAIDIEVVRRAFEAGDPTLNPIIDDVGQYLGRALANLVGLLNTPYILLSSSVAQFGSPLLNRIKTEMERRLMTDLAEQTTVEVAGLDPDIVLLGSAALLLTHELGLF
jgi:glucokinase-like ROK family protein